MSQIASQFSAPDNMADWYAGGSYVPAGTSGTDGAVPSSGTLRFSQFYGTTNYIAPSAVPSTSEIATIFNEGTKTGAENITTDNPVTAEVSNGVGPYSYSWYIASGDTSITIDSPTSATTYCSATVGTNQQKQCVIDCQVTDSHGTKCWTGGVNVSLSNNNDA
jgi:hypothetical protein